MPAAPLRAGLLESCAPGTLLVETSSVTPDLRRRYGEHARQRGIELVDAPMLRSAKDPWEGTVQILLGGSPGAVARAQPVLEAVSEKIIPAGELGNAHVMKALNNAVAMTNHAILSEIFAVGQHLGIRGESLLEMMRGSMAASYKLEDLAPKLLNNEHPRNAKIAFAEKDLSICCRVASETPVLTPVLESAYFTYRLACRMGGAEEPPSRLSAILLGERVLPSL
jgi:3-hydroxyisobutyrate dehydrogenase-like beta-hydroxyacid dehydrogenase